MSALLFIMADALSKGELGMSDRKGFSHISVSSSDETERVIYAGISQSQPETDAQAYADLSKISANIAQRSQSKANTHTGYTNDDACSNNMSFGVNVNLDADISADTDASQKKTLSVSTTEELAVEQHLEDLAAQPMPLVQKIVLVVAVLLIVGFIVYQAFFL